MDLKAGTANYKASIAFGGQNIPLTVKSETKEESGAWVVTETVVTPQGEITDTSTIEKGTLVLKHRVYKQGPVSVRSRLQRQQSERLDDHERTGETNRG